MGTNGQTLRVAQKLNPVYLREQLIAVHNRGIKSIAVVLMHSYIYPNHELEIEKLAKEIGFEQVSLSSQVMPMVKIVPRGYTVCVDAYLTPGKCNVSLFYWILSSIKLEVNLDGWSEIETKNAVLTKKLTTTKTGPTEGGICFC